MLEFIKYKFRKIEEPLTTVLNIIIPYTYLFEKLSFKVRINTINFPIVSHLTFSVTSHIIVRSGLTAVTRIRNKT